MNGYSAAIDIFIVFMTIQITQAEVTIDVKDFNITNTEVTLKNIRAKASITSEDEADEITLAWEDGSRMPKFTYFYTTTSLQDGILLYNILAWNTDRNIEDRKQGNGSVLCTVRKDGNPLKSATFTLNVQYKPEPAKLHLHTTDDLAQGSPIRMTCSCENKGNPEGEVKWTLNGSPFEDVNDGLVINNVTLQHRGPWMCFYQNIIDVGNNSEAVEVDLRTPESALLALNTTGDIVQGGQLQMTCSCTDKGNPVGAVVWNLNGSLFEDDQDVLKISYVTSEHHGHWQCLYRNGIGDGRKSNSIMVDVQRRPGKGVVDIGTLPINRGQQLTLTCNGDSGNPVGKVWWHLNGTFFMETKSIELKILTVDPTTHNGTWTCLFMNKVGNGTESDDKLVNVLLTPPPPTIGMLNNTAISFAITIQGGSTDYNYTQITLFGNGTLLTDRKAGDISVYDFDNLQANTTYNVSVFYNNAIGDGAPGEFTCTTKGKPILHTPTITRSMLAAVVEMQVQSSDSASEIQISVCTIGETDSNNCNIETIQEIEEGDFREEIYGSFSGRTVNVSVYDNGVKVYSYADDIGLAEVPIALIVLAGVVLVCVVIVIIVVVIKKKDKDKKKPDKDVEEEINPYSYSNPAMISNSQSRTGTGPAKTLDAPPIYSVVNKGNQLAPIAASPSDGPVYSKVDWSKKNSRQSLRGSPMSKKAIDKITFSRKDGSINMHLEVSKKFTGEIEIDVCREGDQFSKSKVPKQHVEGTKNVVMVLPIKETSQDKYTINVKFIVKRQMVQEVDLTYPYETNSVNVTVLNDAYVTSGTDVKAQEIPEYSEVNKSKKTKGLEMPNYSEVNRPKKKKKAAEEQPYEDVETKNQSSHNERSTNAVSPSNAEVAVEGVPPHPPRKGAPKEGVMYAELDLNNSGPPRVLPRLGSKSPAHEPVVYADVRPG